MRPRTSIAWALGVLLSSLLLLAGCEDNVTEQAEEVSIEGTWIFCLEGGRKAPFDGDGRFRVTVDLLQRSEDEFSGASFPFVVEVSASGDHVIVYWSDLTECGDHFSVRSHGWVNGDTMTGHWFNVNEYRGETGGPWTARRPRSGEPVYQASPPC